MVKRILASILAPLTVLLFILFTGMPTYAAVSGFVAKGEDGSYYQYNYDDLLDSYALRLLEKPDGLYEHFVDKTTFALINGSNRYIDYKNVLDHYARMLVLGEYFDLLGYITDGQAKTAEMPETVMLVLLDDGEITYTARSVEGENEEENEENRADETEEADEDDEDGDNSEDAPIRKVVVDVTSLRLRNGPSTDHEILSLLTFGTILEVIGSENEWLRVITPEGNKGWVHGDYVRDVEPGDEEADEDDEDGDNSEDAPIRKVVVDVTSLRLRNGPSTDHEILSLLTFGTILEVIGSENEWLRVITPEGNKGWVHGDYVREIDPSGGSFAGVRIVIDPGHGGSDPGAIGITGLQEKVVNLAVAHHLTSLLNDAGASVIMTRNGDYSVSNLQRVQLANTSKVDLFISIHANAFSNPDSNGTETHYCAKTENSSASKYLAQQLQTELLQALKRRDRGVKANSFYVLTNTTMPAALVELAFLTNKEEEEILRDEHTHALAAKALFRGIESYLSQYR